MTTHDFLDHIGTGTKHLLDLFSITVAIGAIVQILPPLAAGMTILWTGLQIYAWFRKKAWRAEVKEAAQAGLDELDKG
jgi:hypothetical protein